MVVTFKTILDQRREKNDRTYPLKIRVNVERKQKEVPLHIYLLHNQWDAKQQQGEGEPPQCHPDYTEDNNCFE